VAQHRAQRDHQHGQRWVPPMKRRSSRPCQPRGVRSLLDWHREGATCCAAGCNALQGIAPGRAYRDFARGAPSGCNRGPDHDTQRPGRRILGLGSIGTRIRYTPPHREERVRIVPRIALRILDAPGTNRTCDPLLRSRRDCVREPIAPHRTVGTTRPLRFASSRPVGSDGNQSRTHPVQIGHTGKRASLAATSQAEAVCRLVELRERAHPRPRSARLLPMT
jgi:hypothetical protein